MKMKEKNIFIIVGSALLLFLFFYLRVFNGNISNESQDWSNFASYLSSMMMIVLTTINIYVFIRLTKVIDKNDETRRRQELNVQKLILLSNLRQSELNKFNDILNNTLMISSSLIEAESSRSLTETTTYIETFVNTKKHIFPFIEEDDFVDKISRLHKIVSLINKKWKESFPKLTENDSQSFIPINLSIEILEFLKLKNDVLKALQEFTIKSLDYNSIK